MASSILNIELAERNGSWAKSILCPDLCPDFRLTPTSHDLG
jgi:hypothetical protein